MTHIRAGVALVVIALVYYGSKGLLPLLVDTSAPKLSTRELASFYSVQKTSGGVAVWEWDGLFQLSFTCREGKYLVNYGKGVRGIWIEQSSRGRSIEVFDSNVDGLVDVVRDHDPSSHYSFDTANASVLEFFSDLANQQHGQQIYVDAASCLRSSLQTTSAAR